MKNKIPFILLVIINITILALLFFSYKPSRGGDIVEYYGMTESISRHADIHLSPEDQVAIEKYLSPIYFSDPQYYIKGVNGERYPVHFFFYSLLLTPAVLILKLLRLHPFYAFSLTNLTILLTTIVYLFKHHIPDWQKRLFLLFLIYASPILGFIVWQGPDLFYVSMLLLATFSFFSKHYLKAAAFAVLASWHSQPLVIIALLSILFYLSKRILGKDVAGQPDKIVKKDSIETILLAFSLGFLLLLPYFFNLISFGVFTPWGLIENGWTQINGFGVQNISLKKLFEQFFDPNMGLLWYAPIVVVLGSIRLIKEKKNKVILSVFLVFLASAFFYQTNPAWHYGSSGFGPTRHILFMIPLLIYLTIQISRHYLKSALLLISFLVIWQLYSLSFNGFLFPNPDSTLYHTPYAQYLLDAYPELYNPTPEIFVDRTDHLDLSYPDDAIYKTGEEICKKAYVQPKTVNQLMYECGYIPEKYKKSVESLKQEQPYHGIYVNY